MALLGLSQWHAPGVIPAPSAGVDPQSPEEDELMWGTSSVLATSGAPSLSRKPSWSLSPEKTLQAAQHALPSWGQGLTGQLSAERDLQCVLQCECSAAATSLQPQICWGQSQGMSLKAVGFASLPLVFASSPKT